MQAQTTAEAASIDKLVRNSHCIKSGIHKHTHGFSASVGVQEMAVPSPDGLRFRMLCRTIALELSLSRGVCGARGGTGGRAGRGRASILATRLRSPHPCVRVPRPRRSFHA